MSDILIQVQDIFRDLFDDEEIEINDSTTAEDIDDWDSITHIQLLVAIEKHFGIKFTASEIHGFKKVGDIINCINLK
ncbi:MAG: acyl carrier protein [Crocinitomicaceae bacterium]|nr:acyl carrier protein [Crocinitomicaceae bacterium]